ncbi:TetR family transcriptional regulator [Paenibacillus baekrokdamisoli]|uniref:TetR family transcriptional regulator n=1 Tax=Paenibacillus baekrokdamisoli TaxID=1712516 RepID=A0A3G9IY38_9BACL|nr:TetR/AcrR family transcriptional regulator [Paenibacillus baekrokdamisoli]MBB3068969.1 AcrR family transcriptional regulator [Paenibacillus baekrokdamisoli]BBH23790.1 TetR family transcriptional regulator [Paenibacillus baekrokdamisoli]
MNGYERRKQKKIENIYSVSFQLFFKFGFQKVSVNEIAQKANVSPATIYNYFGTKEQLYTDMLMNWMDKQLEQYENILDSELSFPEKTKEIMLLEAKNLNILSDEFPRSPSSELSGLMQMMEKYNEQKVMHFFNKFVSLGKQAGYIHKDQTEEMTMFYFTMYKNELGRYWEASDQERVTRSMDQLIGLFFYGLVGQVQDQK